MNRYIEDLLKYFLEGSTAHIASIIFYLSIREGRLSTYIARYLTENGYEPTQGNWRDGTIRYILRNTAYYGKAKYKSTKRCENPNRELPAGVGYKVEKTITRPTPQREWIWFDVPALINKESWDVAQTTVADSSRWRGNSSPKLKLLLRGFIICPLCRRPMKYQVAAPPRRKFPYYSCTSHAVRNSLNRCEFRKSIRADHAEDAAREALKVILAQPEILHKAAERVLSEDLEGGGYIEQVKYWRKKVEDIQQSIYDIQRRVEKNVYNEDEAGVKIVAYRTDLDAARKTLAQAELAFENRSAILRSIEQIELELKRVGSLALEDIDMARQLMLQMRCAYVPDEDGSGEGKLYAFYSGIKPARFGPKTRIHSTVPPVSMGL